MNTPSLKDRIVKVRAYLTDFDFGYEHWRATQFLAPTGAAPAVLVVCRDHADRDAVIATLERAAIERAAIERARP